MARGRADLITSIVLIVIAIAVVVESWRMPTYTNRGSEIWSAPGIVPGLLGLGLLLAAGILFFNSLSAARAPRDTTPVPEEMQGATARVLTVIALCLGYAGGLVGRVPFWLATFVFVFATICIFDLWEPESRPGWKRVVIVAAVIAAIASGAISYVFANLFFVRLP